MESQLKLYKERFDEFQDTIVKSSGAFDNIRQEIGKIDVKINQLDEENQRMHAECTTMDVQVLDYVTEQQSLRNELTEVQKTTEGLKKLSKDLQE
jgi:archaellum component FlaC